MSKKDNKVVSLHPNIKEEMIEGLTEFDPDFLVGFREGDSTFFMAYTKKMDFFQLRGMLDVAKDFIGQDEDL